MPGQSANSLPLSMVILLKIVLNRAPCFRSSLSSAASTLSSVLSVFSGLIPAVFAVR